VASFFVPARLGAQEATRMFATKIVGLGAETGLVFSLVLRVEQIVWAGIGLLAYTALMPGRARPRSSNRDRANEPEHESVA